MGDPTTYVYQLIYDENENNDTKIIQYFIMHGLVLCIRVDSYVSHMFYTWPFSPDTAVPIDIKRKICLSLNTNTIVFAWIYGNSNKYIT